MNIIENIPADRIEPRARIALNGVLFVFGRIREEYERLIYLLISSRRQDLGDQIIACAWNIVDWAEKLRKLLGYGAGIKKRDNWFKELEKAIAPAEEIRHSLQHIDKHMEECFKASLPSVGFLISYVMGENGQGYDIMVSIPSGSKCDGTDKLSAYIKVNIAFTPPVIAATLFIADKQINVTEMVSAAILGEKAFIDYINETYMKVQQPAAAYGVNAAAEP